MSTSNGSPVNDVLKRASYEELGSEEPLRKHARRHVTVAPDLLTSHRENLEVSEPHIPTSPDLIEGKSLRIASLITGPQSKAVLHASKGTMPAVRRSKVPDNLMGKLERMVHLPTDVIYELAKHLRPDDLLRLSRTSRHLRKFFISRRSRPVWTICIKSIGMPPCPEDMCEPQYANLYFESECHACGFPKVFGSMHHLRIRLCKGCAELNVIAGKTLAKEAFGSDVSMNCEIYTLLPWKNMNSYNQDELSVVNRRKIKDRRFFKYDFLKVVSDYLETESGSAERTRFVEQRQQLVRDISKNVTIVGRWGTTEWIAGRNAEEAMRKARRMRICERLQCHGYPREEVEAMSGGLAFSISELSEGFERAREIRRSWNQLVNRQKEVTDRSWRTLLPKLEELIERRRKLDHEETVRENRRKRRIELFTRFKEYVSQHQLKENGQTTLSVTCLLKEPMVIELLEQDECSIELTAERWMEIENKLPELIERHFHNFVRECSAALHSALQDASQSDPASSTMVASDNDESVVWRADAFFFGKWPRIETFAEILWSRREHLLVSWDWLPPDCRTIEVNALYVQVANALLLSSSLPNDTTMEHMENLGACFVCQQCDPVFREQMTWRDLVLHVSEEAENHQRLLQCESHDIRLRDSHKIKPSETPLMEIDPEYSKRSVESLTPFSSDVRSGRMIEFCTLCKCAGMKKVFRYKERLEAHLRSHHGVLPDEARGLARKLATALDSLSVVS